MFESLLNRLEKRWKGVSLLILAAGFAYLGFTTDEWTVEYFDRFFVSEVQAQSLDRRIGDVEKKVDDLTRSVDSREASRLESEIFRLRVESCMQPAGPLRATYENQIAKLISEWRTVVRQPGGSPPVATCRDLGGE